jgi:hypothetical protein
MKIEHQTPNLVLDPPGSWSCLPCLIIQTIRRDPSGADQTDAEHQATELTVGSSTRYLYTFLAS